jgi:Molybdopterin-binding domain of aldehyde dehydrogenase
VTRHAALDRHGRGHLPGVASNAGMIDWIKIVRRRRVRQKAAAYPEYVAILHVARALGRPVKWCDERADSFLLDQQGRGTVVDAELALDQAGNFLCGLARDPLPDGRATCQ